jgi:hypothetical protein
MTYTTALIDGLDQAAIYIASLSPQAAGAWLLAIAAVTAVLYALLDARRYAAIPSIEVPLKPGASVLLASVLLGCLLAPAAAASVSALEPPPTTRLPSPNHTQPNRRGGRGPGRC